MFIQNQKSSTEQSQILAQILTTNSNFKAVSLASNFDMSSSMFRMTDSKVMCCCCCC